MRLEKIIIGKEAKKPLQYVQSVYAVQGRGLEGDRYFYGCGTFNRAPLSQDVREVSLIDYAALVECNTRLNKQLDFIDLRRNLVISGFDYTLLKGKQFCIGDAVFEIVRTSPPCRYLSHLLDADMMQGLKYIGGYRANILKSGMIKVGDDISIFMGRV
ncbi:MAG: MOSC domain-containing protein [Epsilonproteobacteria bacterium]|nr:MOSC domain-containing protein [Campylobacterota bacterium]